MAQATSKEMKRTLLDIKPEYFVSSHYKVLAQALKDVVASGVAPTKEAILGAYGWGETAAASINEMSMERGGTVDLDLAFSALKRDWLRRCIKVEAQRVIDSEEDPLALAGGMAKNVSDLICQADVGKLQVNTLRESMIALQAGDPLLAPELSKNKVFTKIFHIDSVVRMGAGRFGVVAAMTSAGKCLGKGTPVIKYDGSIVPVEQLAVGDVLMGACHDAKTILALGHGREEMFRITPVRGDSFVCNRSHILSLVVSHGCQCGTQTWNIGDTINLSVDSYLKLGEGTRRRLRLWRAGADWDEIETNLDPYLVGLWIGDGSYNAPKICCPDLEIVNYIESQARSTGVNFKQQHQPGKCPTCTLTTPKGSPNPVWNELKKCRVNGEKRIPKDYLINSRYSRLRMLAGLLDTDGYMDPRGRSCFEISTKYDGLKDDILFLARSLGFYASAVTKVSTIKSIGFSGVYWRINICGAIEEIPTIVSRKVAAPHPRRYPANQTGFKVESIGDGEYFGFELGGDGLFLLGDFTVSHNTSFCLQLAQQTAVRGGRGLVVSLEMEEAEINSRRLSNWTGRESWKILNNSKQMYFDQRHLDAADNCLNITCGAGQDWFALDAKIRQVHSVTPLDYVVVDYFTLMEPPQKNKGENSAASYGHISKGAKMLAKDLKCCVIFVAQFNRQTDEYFEPRLKDLKETSNLEQDADFALLMWNTKAQAPTPDDRVIACRIAKNRGGKRGDLVHMYFNPSLCRFTQTTTDLKAA